MKTTALTLTTVLLAGTAFAQSDENGISMDEVPQAAMEAARQAAADYGVSEFAGVAIDNDGGTETYEFSAERDGMGFEVDVLADGTLQEIEEQVEMSAVPQPVASALEAELAGFSPEMIEKSTREDGQQVVYEFEGMHEGNEIDVEINEDGSNFVMNDDMAG